MAAAWSYMSLIKPAKSLEPILNKLKFIGLLDHYLHGDLPAYVIAFEARRAHSETFEKYQISRGSSPSNTCYRFDQPSGLREMFESFRHDPWDDLVKRIWEFNFAEVKLHAAALPGPNDNTKAINKEDKLLLTI